MRFVRSLVMTTTPDFSKLHMSDLLDFCRIIDALRDVKNPVTTYKAVEIRLKVDKRGEPIRNVSDRLQKLSEKLYGKQPNRLTAATRGAGEVRILGEGQRLYRFAISVLKTMQWFRNETAADIDRRLTIHSASAFAAHILPVLLRGYLKRSYFREIWLYEHTQVADILHAVACGQGDIGICIDWPDPGLNKTELLRARRGILLGGAYLWERKLTSRDSLASEVLITYQPNTLRRLKIQDAFP